MADDIREKIFAGAKRNAFGRLVGVIVQAFASSETDYRPGLVLQLARRIRRFAKERSI